MLILDPATVLNSFMSFTVSVAIVTAVVFEILGFPTYMIMSSANGGNLISSFLTLMNFISSSCLKSSGLDFQCCVESMWWVRAFLPSS